MWVKGGWLEPLKDMVPGYGEIPNCVKFKLNDKTFGASRVMNFEDRFWYCVCHCFYDHVEGGILLPIYCVGTFHIQIYVKHLVFEILFI